MLLSRDELLQLSGVQCIAEVLAHHIDYGRVLLRADIAGRFTYLLHTRMQFSMCMCVQL